MRLYEEWGRRAERHMADGEQRAAGPDDQRNDTKGRARKLAPIRCEGEAYTPSAWVVPLAAGGEPCDERNGGHNTGTGQNIGGDVRSEREQEPRRPMGAGRRRGEERQRCRRTDGANG